MPDFANDVYVQSSSMAAQLIQSGYANTVMPYMNMYGNSSIVGAPYIQGGYTNLLLGVDRAATSQQAVKKLNFEEWQIKHICNMTIFFICTVTIGTIYLIYNVGRGLHHTIFLLRETISFFLSRRCQPMNLSTLCVNVGAWWRSHLRVILLPMHGACVVQIDGSEYQRRGNLQRRRLTVAAATRSGGES